jgi:hypothetical protein
MSLLLVITDCPERTRRISEPLTGLFQTQIVDDYSAADLRSAPLLLIDIALTDHARVSSLKERLKFRVPGSSTVFVVDAGKRHQVAQACALGATAVVSHPIQVSVLVKNLLGDIEGLATTPEIDAEEGGGGISTALDALQEVFGCACTGGSLDADTIDRAGNSVIADVQSTGLASWIDTVRKHHSQTYQHCLLVAGTAVAFAQRLGLLRCCMMSEKPGSRLPSWRSPALSMSASSRSCGNTRFSDFRRCSRRNASPRKCWTWFFITTNILMGRDTPTALRARGSPISFA